MCTSVHMQNSREPRSNSQGRNNKIDQVLKPHSAQDSDESGVAVLIEIETSEKGSVRQCNGPIKLDTQESTISGAPCPCHAPRQDSPLKCRMVGIRHDPAIPKGSEIQRTSVIRGGDPGWFRSGPDLPPLAWP